MRVTAAAAVMVALSCAVSAQTLDDLGDLLKRDDIEALWAYVTMGEKK